MSKAPPLLDALIRDLDAADDSARSALAERLQPYLTRAPEQLLDAEQKAKQIGLHPDTLVRMARSGRVVGAEKVGREWRFPTGKVEILPANGRAPTAPTITPSRSRPTDSAAAAAIRRSS